MKRCILLTVSAIFFICLGTVALAAGSGEVTGGIGDVAKVAITNLSGIAKLITAGSYVAGLGFGVGAISKFMAHKTNPTQVPISQPIALLFVAVALMFAPSVFKAGGKTLGFSGVGGISGVTTFNS